MLRELCGVVRSNFAENREIKRASRYQNDVYENYLLIDNIEGKC